MEEPVDSAGPAQLKRGESCRLRVPSGFGHGSRAGHASSRPAVGARHSGTAAGRRRWSPARKRLNGRASSQIRRPWEVIHAGSVSVYRRSVLLSLLSATHRLCPPPATPGQRSASLLGRQKACPSVCIIGSSKGLSICLQSICLHMSICLSTGRIRVRCRNPVPHPRSPRLREEGSRAAR
jgi:hypothetical protein